MPLGVGERKKRRPIVSEEELFLADQQLKESLLAIKKPPKKDKG
ncbi:MAG: hypothetical protein ACXVIS_09945 [Halobacteriota archaeon]